MHRLSERCSFAAQLVAVETVIAKVWTSAHIAADIDRIDLPWLGWRLEHHNKMIRTLVFFVAVPTTDVAVDETIRSSSPELRRAGCLKMATLLALPALHVLGTTYVKVIVDNVAMLAYPL